MRFIEVEQVRSPIRRRGNKRAQRKIRGSQRATLIGLWLNRIGRTQLELPRGASKPETMVEAGGLHPIAGKWISAATSLGLKFLRALRIGAPRPPELLVKNNFASDDDPKRRQDRFSEAVRAIEDRGVGMGAD
jgi:ribosomal protein L30/L7E